MTQRYDTQHDHNQHNATLEWTQQNDTLCYGTQHDDIQLMTFSIMPHSIMTLCVMTLSEMTLST
jgi:hypothetical protein